MKYKFYLNELDCANCANKIEKLLNKDENIDKAIVNFNKLSITVYTSLDKGVLELVSSIVKRIEPDVIVTAEKESKEENETIEFKKSLFTFVAGLILAILGMYLFKGTISKVLIIIAYIMLLYKVFLKALKQLPKKTIDENLLLTISCIGAYFTNNIHEGLMVIILYDLGKILELLAVNNSRKSIKNMMDIKATYANLVDGDIIKQVEPEKVEIGDIILIKAYEKVPLDGIVISGESKLNTSSITGESKPLKVEPGSNVLSGMINTGSILKVKVTANYESSTVSKILKLLDEATDRKAKTETFVSKAARIYTPIILLLAITTIIILPLVFDFSMKDAIYRALVFLVISCPCAIAISVPLSYFSGIGRASKEGILIKGSDYLDTIGDVKKIIFDKTGTLTTGEFTDYDLIILDNEYKKEDIIKYYCSLEKLSNHPIAKSINNLFNVEKHYKVNEFKEVAGSGLTGKINNKIIQIGSASYCKSNLQDEAIYLSIDKSLVAKLFLKDGLKKDSKKTINTLKELAIDVSIYTGDNKDIAHNIGNTLGITDVKSQLLPQDKFELLKETIKDNEHVAFVGDGVNDAPSLSIAPIGVSLGGVGSDVAIEAPDIVIMNDQIAKIPTCIKLSRYTRKIIKENLTFAILVKVLVLVLNILGIASMYQAVFADTGVTLLTILNTTRILKKDFK